MKSSMNQVYKRQQAILQRLHDQQAVVTEELAAELQVSSLTIRRDLQVFARQGLVRCVRGGANLIAGALKEDPSNSQASLELQARKDAIAQLAATLVEPGDTIFINSSSTAIQMLKYIRNRRVIVITNNGMASSLPIDPQIELIYTGGVVHANKMSMVGDVAMQNLSRIMATKVFLGVSGISARGGITTSVLQETAINDLMIRRAHHHCYVLADGSKVGVQNNFMIGPASLVTVLITDQTADPGDLFQLTEAGVQILQTSQPAAPDPS